MRKFCLKRSDHDHRDITIDIPRTRDPLPVAFSLREEMPPVFEQGVLGSCASNACSIAIQYLLKKAHLPEMRPSRLFIYYNTRVKIACWPTDEDTGACMRDICKSIAKFHACDEAKWPYEINKFDIEPSPAAYMAAHFPRGVTYYSVRQNLDDMKRVLLSNRPILAGLMIYESFDTEQVAKTGVISMPDTMNEQALGGHAVLLVGYDDQKAVFIGQNSWGTEWGAQGFFFIPYEYVLDDELAFDFWALSFTNHIESRRN
jgi:C1A family cysteine protease